MTVGFPRRGRVVGTSSEIQDVLSIASVQGRGFLSALAIVGCGIVLQSADQRAYGAALLSAVGRDDWVVHVGDALVFCEEYGLHLSPQRHLEGILGSPEWREDLCVGLIEEIVRWKSSPQWDTLSEQVRVMLLDLRVRLAATSSEPVAGRIDHASAAVSASTISPRATR